MSDLTYLQKQARENVEKAHADLKAIVMKFAVENNMIQYDAEKRLDLIGSLEYRNAKKRFEDAYTKRYQADMAAERSSR